MAREQSLNVCQVQSDRHCNGKQPEQETSSDLEGPGRIQKDGIVAASALHNILMHSQVGEELKDRSHC